MKSLLLSVLFAVSVLQVHAADAPTGSSPQVLTGRALYKAHCAVCHGANGRDAAAFPRPIWGQGQDIKRFKTARGLFEYLQMLMPFDDPYKINDAEKTSITAFLLVMNGDLPPNVNLPAGGDASQIK
jgi:cytochrome c